ncbi:hypothetical protein CONLIGDRAFT_565921, partial [Coniochaeta ligniaria NRRL 30616]
EAFPRGYPSLSAFLHSDRDFAMFRSFGRLHARVLLHKQDELVQLEQRLDQLDQRASETDPYVLTTNRRHSATTAERQALLGEVEAKLKEYDTLLSSFLDHLERPQPEETEIQSVINWMDGKKPLVREESTFLNDWSDLRRSRQSQEKGGLEVLLGRCATSPRLRSFCKEAHSRSDDANLRLLDQSKLLEMSRSIATIFAVLALIIPVVVLYSVQAVASRLWIISGFTAMFSSALRLLTLSRNFEIFSATAAYCAVMVVFVGSLP